jgi:hypothetical protein
MKNRAQCNNFLLDIQDFALRALLCRTWYGQRLENCPEKDSSRAARALPVVQVTGGGLNWKPMSATTNIPVEVYLRSSYEPDAEYVDGKIEERPMGEIGVIDPQDCVYYRYDEGQLLRKDSFALAERGIAFQMDRIKELVN